MAFKPDKAFVLAAGLGTRMRPLTESCPKPLLKVGGETLLDRALDALAREGVRDVTVNAHHHPDLIEAYLARRKAPRANISREPELLDTGGGIKKALPALGENPFYVIAGDAWWSEGPKKSALRLLADFWDDSRMDILLLLQPVRSMKLTKGVGDYGLAPNGKATRSRSQNGEYMFTSLRLTAPGVFENTPDGPFSYLDLMDRAEEAGRLYGLVHDGDWHHISTPEDLARVNAALAGRGG